MSGLWFCRRYYRISKYIFQHTHIHMMIKYTNRKYFELSQCLSVSVCYRSDFERISSHSCRMVMMKHADVFRSFRSILYASFVFCSLSLSSFTCSCNQYLGTDLQVRMNCLIVKLQNRMERDAKVRRRKNRRSGISCHSYANSLFTVHKISVVYKSSVRFRRSAFYIHIVFFWLPSEFYFCSHSTDIVRVCVCDRVQYDTRFLSLCCA